MASNDVELSEEPQLDSAASHNPVVCQPDMTSGHVRDDPRAGMIRRARSRHRASIFGKLDRASGLRRSSPWIDPERKLALVLLTNRTWLIVLTRPSKRSARPFSMRLQKEWRRDAVAARRIKESETQVGARMKGGSVWGPQLWPQ